MVENKDRNKNIKNRLVLNFESSKSSLKEKLSEKIITFPYRAEKKYRYPPV